ncbi:hypothetical protein Pint_10898 [Pistacia integerrima]|uniref:Uncharacterized protein n=1 Tax=Pistacia integerrima TaxID=434235 RepID=A0ACC0XGS5_9ROSI|nr:hypothetical protein Pint_10898 [Pistacia integerrima]
MLLHKTHHFVKQFSTSINWRRQIKQTHLVHRISSILLQRNNWTSLLQNLNLSSKLTPSIFLQILKRTQNNPQMSLNFFNWTKTNLHFNPDLKSQCHIILLAVGSAQLQLVKPILDSSINSHSATVFTRSMIEACKGRDSQSDALSLVLECYSIKGLFIDGLEVYRMMRVCGCVPFIRACNKLLDAIYRENEIRLCWCLYGAMIRDGILPDKFTWSVIAQILWKDGKCNMILRLLDLGIYNSFMYNLVIEFYSKSGDFTAAFERLTEMYDKRKIHPGFSTYSSILDGACKYENIEVADRIMGIMVEKTMRNDSIIQKLCDLGKTYAAEKIFKRACDEKIDLRDDTYGCMLRASSEEGRVKEAIHIYQLILKKAISVKDSSYHAFVNALCQEDQPGGVRELLRDLIKKGYSPSVMELSKFVSLQCFEGSGLIDKAFALHAKIEKLKGSLDVKTYNALLDGLFKSKRIEEAVSVFDYMNKLNLVSSSSFGIMIRGLCGVKQLKKAMKIHDEMLKMGHKPDEAAYKGLISGFK